MPRGRIIDQLRLGGGEGPRLILVAAPPGFGKTTLLAQWLAAEDSQRRVAWLALDAGDADLRVFLTHLVAAIQTAEPEVGVDAPRPVGGARCHANRGCVGQPDQRSRRPGRSHGGDAG